MSLTKRRSTGPSPAVRQLVWERDGGCCVRCGIYGGVHTFPPHQIHHRRPRGMGGTRREDTNSPANLVLLCGGYCHRYIESDRLKGLETGYLVQQGHDPATTPIRYRGRWVLLTHDGQIKECP